VWQRKVVNDESIAVAISQLRKLLNDDARTPRYIKTIPGVGYQFIAFTASDNVLSSAPNEVTATTGSHNRFQRPVVWIGAAAILVALILASAQRYIAPATSAMLNDETQMVTAMQLMSTGQEAALRKSIVIFHEVLHRDANNANAWLGLAEAKMRLLGDRQVETENYLELLTLLRKALSIEPSLARAHLWMANLIFWHDRNFDEARYHYETGMRLDPNDELIQLHYAHMLMVQKHFDEARDQIGNVRNLDPLQYSSTQLAWVYLLEGNYQAAAKELERIAATEETSEDFHRAAQNVYLHLGDEQRTFTHLQWFFQHANFDQEKVALLNQQFAFHGIKGVYQWLLDTKEPADLGQFTPPISWARYAVAANRKDIALDYLKQAFDTRHLHTQCVAADPLYQPLYKDQRFHQLITSNVTL